MVFRLPDLDVKTPAFPTPQPHRRSKAWDAMGLLFVFLWLSVAMAWALGTLGLIAPFSLWTVLAFATVVVFGFVLALVIIIALIVILT